MSAGQNTGVRAVIEVLARALTELGRVIGKQGRTAAALRTLAATAGEKEGKTVTLEIRDTPFKG
jgi:predicted RNA-binding protein YlqC (UPF0109 family)